MIQKINLSASIQQAKIKQMQENMKQSGQSFLDKFKGRAKKVSKQGINQLLKQRIIPLNKQAQYKSLESSRDQLVLPKSPTKVQTDKSIQAKRLAADMDELFASNSDYSKNKKVALKKITNRKQIVLNPQQFLSNNPQKKQRFLPPLYTPEKSYKRNVSTNQNSSMVESRQQSKANSQFESINSQKRSKYVFGKYLKLDEQAMKHFQFLKNIEKKTLFKDKQHEITFR